VIGLCTDSNSQLPPELIDRFGIAVVPITVNVDDVEYLEGVDLDADGFYGRFENGHAPVVSTSQPSPGQFALAYEELIASGCTSILSIHLSAAVSGTLNSARLAARSVPVPVRLIDTGTASFGVGCCVWAAADAISNGASFDQATAIAANLAPQIGNVFIVSAFDMMQSGGRIANNAGELLEGSGIPILSLVNGEVQVVQRVGTIVEAVNAMAEYALRWGDGLRIAVGMADRAGSALGEALAEAVRPAANVREVIHYRIGPSVGAHTGPGTAGCFMFPAEFVPTEAVVVSSAERRRTTREPS
jgi:DegV family protein with EDD domain